jgi:hypothetical protein
MLLFDDDDDDDDDDNGHRLILMELCAKSSMAALGKQVR